MKPSWGGLVILKTNRDLGDSASSASTAAVLKGVRMNWSTSRMNVGMKAGLGG